VSPEPASGTIDLDDFENDRLRVHFTSVGRIDTPARRKHKRRIDERRAMHWILSGRAGTIGCTGVASYSGIRSVSVTGTGKSNGRCHGLK